MVGLVYTPVNAVIVESVYFEDYQWLLLMVLVTSQVEWPKWLISGCLLGYHLEEMCGAYSIQVKI